MIAEILKEEGYGTYAVGKWHLAPPADLSPIGPFGQWPTGRGFDRFYGFLGGEEDQWAPELWEDQHHAPLPEDPNYHLSEDLVNRAQQYLSDHVSVAPEQPFYLHLAFGAGHAPHQAPASFIDRYRGAFDHGWDVERQRVLARQIELGVVPEGTQLPASNPGVERWNDLTSDQKRLYARMQEVFAGFMEHADAQIGRLVEYLRDYELLEDTVIVLMSDNGASGEGGAHGSANEYRYFLGVEDSFEDNLAMIDELGGRFTHNHYPSGWAQAGNTPLRMYKKYNFAGGVRVPFIVHYPKRISDSHLVRRRFQHVTDVVPTIMDLLELKSSPSTPLHKRPHGRSFVDALEDPAAEEGVGRTQYFETAGFRGIVKDGWKAIAQHEPGTDYDSDKWELFRVADDFAETSDLSDEKPDLVESLVAEWWDQAEAHAVLPLDDRMQTRVHTRNTGRERARYRLLPGVRLPNGASAPGFGGREFTVTVNLREIADGENGVLVAYGRRAAGFVLYMSEGYATFELNRAGLRTVIRAERPALAGTASISLQLKRAGELALAELRYDADVVAVGELPSLMPAGFGCLSLQIGFNSPSPVSELYSMPARFTGRIHDAVIEFATPVEGMSADAWQMLLRSE